MKYFKKILCCLLFCFTFFSCELAASFDQSGKPVDLTLDKTRSVLQIGEMDFINLTASGNQNTANIRWIYDDSVILVKGDNYGAVITGLKTGKTVLTADCNGSLAKCTIEVTEDSFFVDIANPYVYASDDYLEVKPGETKRISASLYGGTPGDINGYRFSIDKPETAQIQYEGNYCWITGLTDGFAKLTVQNQTRTSLTYSVLINVTDDQTVKPYITTEKNIVTINRSEKKEAVISFDLKNYTKADYDSSFRCTLTGESGQTATNAKIVSQGGTVCTVEGLESGTCYLVVSHPDALYPLEILIRVIEDSDIPYIEATQSIVTLSGDSPESISLDIQNYTKEIDPALFTWAFSDNFSNYCDYIIYNGSSDNTGNYITLTGKKTGSVKMTVNYPNVKSKSIVVIIRDQKSEAASAETVIRASETFLKLKPDSEPVKINLSLVNCSEGDTNNLEWHITNMAEDGSVKPVINWTGGAGLSFVNNARSAGGLTYSESAYGIIEPVNPGTAVIEIKHPKALYSAKINVTVTDKENIKLDKSFLSFTGNPVFRLKNGTDSLSLNVSFSGTGNENEISWTKSEESHLVLSPNGKVCAVTPPEENSGLQRSTVTVTHDNCDYPLQFIVWTYDTEEELSEINEKSFYTRENYFKIKKGSSQDLYVNLEGFGPEENPLVKWTCTSDNKNFIQMENVGTSTLLKTTPEKAGIYFITASLENFSDIYFVIEVKDENIINEDDSCWLSSDTNVLYFEKRNETKTFEITMNNIKSYSAKDLVWKIDNLSDYEIISNGTKADITSLTDKGQGLLTVTHPLSENTLTVNLKTGEQYEYRNEDVTYITTENDTYELYEGQDAVEIYAKLNHTSGQETGAGSGFTFTSDDSKILKVEHISGKNYASLIPVKQGITQVKITHPDSPFEKEVMVIVKPVSNAENIPYITSNKNVVTIIKENFVTLQAELKNTGITSSSDWTWISSDTKVVSIVANNGPTCLVSGNKNGTAEITVKHKSCIFSFKFIVIVLDSGIVETKPYINVSETIVTVAQNESKTVTAEMIGGKSGDEIYFNWLVSSSQIAVINGTQGSCYIRGQNKGTALITVSNSKYSSSYSRTVLVIVEDSYESGVYIKPELNVLKMKPDDESSLITAELVNAEVMECENLVWWTDDASIASISAAANTCQVTPTGKSGVTKIHIKHPKARSISDILVYISAYDEFKFEVPSASIEASKLYFYPLQVPQLEAGFSIKYETSNPNVCIIDGSNSVAMVVGTGWGTANLTAKMLSKDGEEISRAEMIVTVQVPEKQFPIISIGQAILTMEIGDTQTITANITGENVSGNEKYSLKWTIKEYGDGKVSFLTTESNECYGDSCIIKGIKAGECVITVTHEKTGARTDIYININEKNKLDIELSSYLEEIYMNEGTFTINAKVINGRAGDESKITWNSVNTDGDMIVSVSKTTGPTCTITPRKTGHATIIARLPDGAMKRCQIIVRTSMEVKFDVGTIHVIPGYTEYVNYSTNPQNASLRLLPQYADSENIPFTFYDDTSNKRIAITGKRDFPDGQAGTITATILGGAGLQTSPQINVFVQYSVDMSLYATGTQNVISSVHNSKPDTKNVKTFEVVYYPNDIEFSVESTDENLVTIGNISESAVEIDHIAKTKKTVTLIPHAEGRCEIKVNAHLPNDTSHSYDKTESLYYSAFYDAGYTIVPHFEFSQPGAFTRFENRNGTNILKLGDGEEAVFYLEIKEENASGSIGNPKWIRNSDMINTQEFAEVTDSNLKDITKDRASLKSIIFKGNSAEKKVLYSEPLDVITGLIRFSQDEESGTKKTFRLNHAWDYYKELPRKDDGKIDETKTDDIDFYLVTKDYLVNQNGTKYRMVDKGSFEDNPQYPLGNITNGYYIENETVTLSRSNYPVSNTATWWRSGILCNDKPVHFNKDLNSSYRQEKYFPEYWYETVARQSMGTGTLFGDWVFRKSYLFVGYATLDSWGKGNELYNKWAYESENWGGAKDLEQEGVNINQSSHVNHYNVSTFVNTDTSLVSVKPYVITKEEYEKNIIYQGRYYNQKDNVENPGFKGGILDPGGIYKSMGIVQTGQYTSSEQFELKDSSSTVINYKRNSETGVSPTISKNPQIVRKNPNIGSIVIPINYPNGHSMVNANLTTIQVDFEQRNCEAYTNSNWSDTQMHPGFVSWERSDTDFSKPKTKLFERWYQK